ncbi:MAG: hypothetical protein ACHQHM_02955, partial [Thermoanaerobaculales bacterium]
MPENTEFEVVLKVGVESQEKVLSQVVAELQKVNATMEKQAIAATEAKKAQKDLHDEVERGGGLFDTLKSKVLGAVAGFVSLAAAVRFLWSSFNQAVEADKQMAQLRENAVLLGNATQQQVSNLDSWVNKIEHAGGLMKEQLVPAVIQLMGATKDLTAAQLLAEVASGAAARGIGTFEGNVSNLARAIETGRLMGTSPFVQFLRETIKGGGDASDMLKRLVKDFGDAGAGVHTVAMELSRQKVAWTDSKEAMGRAIEGLQSVAAPALKALSYVLATLESAFIGLVGIAKASWYELTFRSSEAQRVMNEASKKGAEVFQGVIDAWAKGGEAAKRSAKAQADASKIIVEAFEKAQKAQKEAKEKADKEDKLPRGREEKFKAIDAIDPLTGMPYSKELEEGRKARATEADEITKNEKKLLDIYSKFYAGKKKMSLDDLRDTMSTLQEALHSEELTDQDREDVHAAMGDVFQAIDDAVAKNAVDKALDTADQTTAALAEAFPKIKGFALANAVVKMGEAAQNALATVPFVPVGLAMMALALERGMQNIETIENANPSGGGVSMPTRSAQPSVYMGGGYGGAGGGAPSVSNTSISNVNAPATTVVHVNTLVGTGAVAASRAAARVLAKGQR